MSELEIHLKRIQDKLQHLMKQHTALQKENHRLAEELKKTKSELPHHQQSINDLKQQVEILKISSGNWNEQDKKDFEKRINVYLKEIDRCIALLSQ
ncbi:MAG: hypothetical protein M3O67_01590 [Bacteroidota bacterium]|nr:hypothetical protein [Bacteroidota bacterium]